MELKLVRKYCKDEYTIGHLYVVENGKDIWVADTLEDKVRDYNKDGDLLDEGETKVYGETAIGYGKYEITLDIKSPKFSRYEFYQKSCNGYLPRLLNVPHFEGILIHCAEGNRGAELLQGCIGVGENTMVGGLTDCKKTFIKLYDLLLDAKHKQEKIWIEIV